MDLEHAAMSVKDVSIYLNLAKSTIYKLAQEGKLPGRKIGGRWRFSRAELDRWLQHPIEADIKRQSINNIS